VEIPVSARQFLSLSAAFGVAAAILGSAGPAAALVAQQPPGVRTEATDSLGTVYADPHGKTLYTWAGDKPGQSKCNAERFHKIVGLAEITYYLPEYQTRPTCQEIWAPFAATAEDRAVGNWTVITREDKSRQWAYLGKALYTFVGDSSPGEVNATSLGRAGLGRKPLLTPTVLPPGIAIKTTIAGRVLRTSAGRALYTKKSEGASKISCGDSCLNPLDPLLAPALVDLEPGEWSVVDRSDGGRQWAFRGKALYIDRTDLRSGDMVAADKPGWTPVTLQAPLKPPTGFRLEMASMGPVLADASGKSLYLFGCVDEGPDRALCDIPQAPQNSYWESICGDAKTCTATWRPVVASPRAKPVGKTWSIVALDPTGARQYAAPGQADAVMAWAYKGRPIYTYVGDKAPGDTYGHRVSASYYWGFGLLGAGTDGVGGDLFD
jgi:predicted lipoprotein with Yx(FWY)xxD motif